MNSKLNKLINKLHDKISNNIEISLEEKFLVIKKMYWIKSEYKADSIFSGIDAMYQDFKKNNNRHQAGFSRKEIFAGNKEYQEKIINYLNDEIKAFIVYSRLKSSINENKIIVEIKNKLGYDGVYFDIIIKLPLRKGIYSETNETNLAQRLLKERTLSLLSIIESLGHNEVILNDIDFLKIDKKTIINQTITVGKFMNIVMGIRINDNNLIEGACSYCTKANDFEFDLDFFNKHFNTNRLIPLFKEYKMKENIENFYKNYLEKQKELKEMQDPKKYIELLYTKSSLKKYANRNYSEDNYIDVDENSCVVNNIDRGSRIDHGGGSDGDSWLDGEKVNDLAQSHYNSAKSVIEEFKTTLEKYFQDIDKDYKVSAQFDYGEKGHCSVFYYWN